MPLNSIEQLELEETIRKWLRDISRPNPLRLKAGLRILMTTNFDTFETVCSNSVQQELAGFKKLLSNPEIRAPQSTATPKGREETIHFIKHYTLDNFYLMDNRTSILPNTNLVQKSIIEGERLKSVVHASAMHNVLTNAHHFESLTDKLKESGVSNEKVTEQVNLALQYTRELQKAVAEGDISHILKCLSHHGVDINLPDAQGMTPLHLAAREGLTETLKLLLTVPNINPNPISSNGWTPLHIAARLGHSDIVDALLAVPEINPNTVNSDGWTALHWAAWHGFTETVTVLLTAPGIMVNLADKNATTAFHLAARNGHAHVMAVLLSIHNLEINARDNEQRTPLHLAVMYNHEEAVNLLLSVNAIEVNLKDVDGLTPLHWAARHGYSNILNALLKHPDILVDEEDNSGLSARQWAKRHGHFMAEKYLSGKNPPSGSFLKHLKKFLHIQ